MGIQKYKAFLKTVELGNLSRAAESMGYTQSAISKMISDLEEEWDVTLFNRYRSGAVITSEGIALLPHVQDIVRGYDNLLLTVAELNGLRNATLRIGCFTSIATNLLPALLKSFHEKYPQLRVHLLNGEYTDVREWLRRGEIDCGFVPLPAPEDLDAQLFYRDSLVAVVPPDSPLAAQEAFDIEALRELDFVCLKENQDHEVLRFLEQQGVAPKTVYEVTNDYAILSMVESGMGVSIVHDLILHPGRYHIARIPLNVKKEIEIGIAVRRGSAPSTLTRMFMQYALSHLGEQLKK